MLADHRDINTQMMPAELHHPRLRVRWLTENRQVIQGGTEHRPLAASFALAAFTAFALAAALALSQLLIAVHDIDNLLIAALAKHGSEYGHRLVLLLLGQVAELDAVSRHHRHGKIGPARFLVAAELV